MRRGSNVEKITFVVHGFPAQRLAGTELYVFYLARAFQDWRVRVEVIFPTYSRAENQGISQSQNLYGIKATTLNIHLKDDYVTRFRDEEVGEFLAQYLADARTELVHFHHLIGFTGSALKKCARIGIPAFLTLHDASMLCDQSHLIRSDGRPRSGGPQNLQTCASCTLHRRPALRKSCSESSMAKMLEERRKYLSQVIHLAKEVMVPSIYLQKLTEKNEMIHSQMCHFPLGIY